MKEKLVNKNVFSESITPIILESLKKAEISILNDLVEVCKKNNIFVFLFAGTLLGAVRHQGFIPWDDDIDVLMKASDMVNIPQLVENAFPGKYFFAGLFCNNPEDPFNGMKMMRNKTILVEEVTYGFPYTRGIDIDIFPLCSAPRNRLFKKIRMKRIQLLCNICSVKYEQKYKINYLLESPNATIKKFYRKRRIISRLFFWHSYRKWVAIRDKYWLKEYKSNQCLIHLYGGDKDLSFEDIFPGTILKFEDGKYLCPSNYSKCLSIHYGDDYMELPPMNKRVTRPFKQITFYEDSNN